MSECKTCGADLYQTDRGDFFCNVCTQRIITGAKDAEIARLKVDRAKLGLFNHGLQAYSDELKAENSRLRDALEEYAKPDNWQSEAHLGRYVVYKPFAEINENHPAPWLKAREALASPPKEEKL